KPKAAEAEPKAPLRTVAVVTPPRKTYARAIRISGLTEADKRAVLATRVAGVIDKLPVKQGDHVKTGDAHSKHSALVGFGQARDPYRPREGFARRRH
ncbi:biotin/lipoyl-binding protein, partial [Mesorhizobium sp. M8A.F.Ca.ET.197.01.1.1]|uniref:biotin/lipoyl-binding protein n=1 Tax=Mesorhizobium sp. M8A.F.Ca.ET.197.01.1.1 TaxID=2563965 RepID=UPI001FE0069E